MSIINNSHAIGVDSRNLVLKTRGSLHVKVGDRYYEIDFRNLKSEETEEEEKEKEQYIITIDNESAIADMEFPGDGKLIIGMLDGTMYVTVKGKYVNVSPKISVHESNEESNKKETNELPFEIDSAFVAGKLTGADDTELDFANNSFITNDVTVRNSFSFPKSTVLMNCCKSNALNTDYRNYDFIELTAAITNMKVKSGVMVKSNIAATINVSFEEYNTDISFESGCTYMIYIQQGLLTYTKL